MRLIHQKEEKRGEPVIPLVFGRAEDAYKMEDVLTLMFSPSSQEIFLGPSKSVFKDVSAMALLREISSELLASKESTRRRAV
mmetsp:Transcript_23907/g.52019  ORF Transcript_23907/g.52019 Transcript_23907/m.52019 type:complete len:82 (+) Transcript_23907:404-649(+)